MLKFLASHDMDTTRGKNGAFTRKRPGQASGSDHPRQPQSQSLLRGGQGQPPPNNLPYDYQEAVPLHNPSHHSRSRRGPSSRPADYEEAVPIPLGMSKRDNPQLSQQQQRGLSNHPPPPSRGPSQLSSSRRGDTRGGAANGSFRASLPHPHQHQQGSSRSKKSGRDADSAAIRREVGELSIHEPQHQQRQGRSLRYDEDDDGEGVSDYEDDEYRHQGSRRGGSVAPPRARVSFLEPPSRGSMREGSRYESRKSRR